MTHFRLGLIYNIEMSVTWIIILVFCAGCVLSYKLESDGNNVTTILDFPNKDVADGLHSVFIYPNSINKVLLNNEQHDTKSTSIVKRNQRNVDINRINFGKFYRTTSKPTANFDEFINNYMALFQATNLQKSPKERHRETKKIFPTDIHTNYKNLLYLKGRRHISSSVVLNSPAFEEKANLGDSCILSELCPEGSGCINDTCDCKRDYIREELECVKPNFGTCNESIECPKYSECSNGSCVCTDGYAKRDYKCVNGIEDDCYNDDDCQEFMEKSVCHIKANGNICQCPSGYVDYGSSECLKKTIVGGLCRSQKQCPPNTWCDDTCICESRHIRKGSECVPSEIGSPCEENIQCPSNSFCDNGTCACWYFHAYREGKCITLIVGDLCKETKECPLWSLCDGVCVCKSHFIRNGSKCIRAILGGSCKQTKECPLFSLCRAGTCVCKDDFVRSGPECKVDLHQTYIPDFVWGIVAAAAVVFILLCVLAIFLILRRKRKCANRNGTVYNTPAESALADIRRPVTPAP